MADTIDATGVRIDTTKFKINTASSSRLAAMTGLKADALNGRTIGELVKQFPHQIDPNLFLFRRVCGTVVKTDPATGVDFPVPFATVQVEDTDCSFLGYFPVRSPWSWYFPFRCRREVIATTKTDACGHFCVWVPRFDIDWVLRFRKERKCYPVIFERPNLRDLIEQVVPRIPHSEPGPDPAPFGGLDRGTLIARVADSFGGAIATKFERLHAPVSVGSSTVARDAALDAPAQLDHLRPPLTPEFKTLDLVNVLDDKKPHPAVGTLSARLAIGPADLKAVDLRRYIGPFKRCYDVIFPEWVPMIDIPDITFRVLQDTNGDGVDDVIYGESYFNVRWNSGNIAPVTLHAWPNARATALCGPTKVPCGNTPAVVTAGRLPVTGDPTIYNAGTGYALHVNRPHPSGHLIDSMPATTGEAPVAGVLSLFGCNKTNPGATHYRLRYRYSADRGATFTAPTSFVDYGWWLSRLNGSVTEWHRATPDALGWYPIALPAGPAWTPENLLLDWPSYQMPDGVYAVTLQLGTGGSSVIAPESAEVRFTVDNSAPSTSFSVETSTAETGPWAPIDQVCPVVKRGATPHDMFFRVRLTVSARHLRSASMSASGCGGGNVMIFKSGTVEHWHTMPSDNDEVLEAVYQLPAGMLQGTYGFGGVATGRAFNPNDADGADAASPWQYDVAYSNSYPGVYFSVINANP